MKCVLILAVIVILQCSVYSYDDWHHTVTKHIHHHKHDVSYFYLI